MKSFKRYIEEVYKNSSLGDWFHKDSAGGDPGWDRYNTAGEKVGKCGDSDEGDAYAACLSKSRAWWKMAKGRRRTRHRGSRIPRKKSKT